MKKGFTIIELVVVVVIIGILLSIVIPKLNQQKEKQIQPQTQENFKKQEPSKVEIK